MIVQVHSVDIPAGSTLGIAAGVADSREIVTFGVDHRLARGLGEAVSFADEAVLAEVEGWQILSISEPDSP
jgi:hypothetical protein